MVWRNVININIINPEHMGPRFVERHGDGRLRRLGKTPDNYFENITPSPKFAFVAGSKDNELLSICQGMQLKRFVVFVLSGLSGGSKVQTTNTRSGPEAASSRRRDVLEDRRLEQRGCFVASASLSQLLATVKLGGKRSETLFSLSTY